METSNRKPNWASMPYEAKRRNILQCIEAGFSEAPSADWVEKLKTGYENDPDWFNFEIEEEDWDNIRNVYENL